MLTNIDSHQLFYLVLAVKWRLHLSHSLDLDLKMLSVQMLLVMEPVRDGMMKVGARVVVVENVDKTADCTGLFLLPIDTTIKSSLVLPDAPNLSAVGTYLTS